VSQFKFHSVENAPTASRPLLEKIAGRFGFVPGMLAGMAESPAALEGYLTLAGIFERSSLSPVEQQVVMLATSVENGCEFCVSAHSFIARNMVKVDSGEVDALRRGGDLKDRRLDALATFTRQVVRGRGCVEDGELQFVLNAGFTRAQVLDVILGVSVKTLSNYINHLLKTPLDAAFEKERWSRAA